MVRRPRRLRYGKQFKGGTGLGTSCGVVASRITRGRCGLVVMEASRRSARQREGCRTSRRHHRIRQGKVWWVGYPSCPVTGKPRAVRIGNRKGSVAYWAIHVRAVDLSVEVRGVHDKRVERALLGMQRKRSVGTKRVRIR